MGRGRGGTREEGGGWVWTFVAGPGLPPRGTRARARSSPGPAHSHQVWARGGERGVLAAPHKRPALHEVHQTQEDSRGPAALARSRRFRGACYAEVRAMGCGGWSGEMPFGLSARASPINARVGHPVGF